MSIPTLTLNFFFHILPFRELLSSDAMKDYNRARVYLDENYKSQEHFTVNFQCLFRFRLCSNNVRYLSSYGTCRRAISGVRDYKINVLQALIHAVITRHSSFISSLILFGRHADIVQMPAQYPSYPKFESYKANLYD